MGTVGHVTRKHASACEWCPLAESSKARRSAFADLGFRASARSRVFRAETGGDHLSARVDERRQRWGDAVERGERRKVAQRSFQRAAHAVGAQRLRDGLVVTAYLSVRKDGRLAQLHLPGVPPPQAELRGECDGFSEDSQRRLKLVLHSIRRDAELPVMVTLTFPAELTVTPSEAKACRLAWEKRMRRRYGPRWCNVWRLEAHPEMSLRLGRVHPHFHLLTWGAWYDLAEVSRTWQAVVWEVLKIDECLSDDEGMPVAEKHRAAGTNCERLRCWGGVLYCGKNYIAKAEEFPLGKAGRVWGWHNRAALPMAEEIRIPLTHAQAVTVRLAVEDWMRRKRIVSENLICTFFDDDPEKFVGALLSWERPQITRPLESAREAA